MWTIWNCYEEIRPHFFPVENLICNEKKSNTNKYWINIQIRFYTTGNNNKQNRSSRTLAQYFWAYFLPTNWSHTITILSTINIYTIAHSVQANNILQHNRYGFSEQFFCTQINMFILLFTNLDAIQSLQSILLGMNES